MKQTIDIRQIKEALSDTGCDSAVQREIEQLLCSGRAEDALQVIRMDRCRMMEEFHALGRKVDCIDHLIRRMEKELQKGKEINA